MQFSTPIPAVTRTSLGDMFSLDVGDRTGVLVHVTSIGGGGTLVFEGTIDGTNWFALAGVPTGGGAAVSSVNAAGAWLVNSMLASRFRLRLSAYTSGNITALGSTAPDR